MDNLKSFGAIVIVLIAFLGYSYYNYAKRSKAVDTVVSYMDENNLKQIWHLRELHLNVFDWIIEDKSQFNFIFVDADLLDKESEVEYQIRFSSWKDPQDVETLTNYTLHRQRDKFQIIMYDMFWIPNDKDSLTEGEIHLTIFEIVDDWVKNN